MKQSELRSMAEERVLDAAALLAGGRWSFAYYVAGYAVECALKSCVLARMIYTGGVFRDRKFSEWCWTHDFADLVKLAGLTDELNGELSRPGNPFAAHWGLTAQWRETSRYEVKTQAEARALFEAITADPDGVLKWIRNFW